MIAAHPDVAEAGESLVLGLAQNRKLGGKQVEIRWSSDINAKHSFAMPTTGTMPTPKYSPWWPQYCGHYAGSLVRYADLKHLSFRQQHSRRSSHPQIPCLPNHKADQETHLWSGKPSVRDRHPDGASLGLAVGHGAGSCHQFRIQGETMRVISANIVCTAAIIQLEVTDRQLRQVFLHIKSSILGIETAEQNQPQGQGADDCHCPFFVPPQVRPGLGRHRTDGLEIWRESGIFARDECYRSAGKHSHVFGYGAGVP